MQNQTKKQKMSSHETKKGKNECIFSKKLADRNLTTKN